MSVLKTARDLRGGASVEDHVAGALEAAEADEANAWVSLDPEGARERARALDERPADERDGTLYGLTVSVKDNIAVAGRPLTCASAALEGYEAPYTASAVDRLREAGAVVLGKGNMDEFGCGSSGETSAHGPTENPRAPGRVPGGSSSGAGAALADEQVDVALGSDTGGSTRCPAAFCGVTALKPSYGLVSRAGLVDLAMSLESPAPMARAGDTRALAATLEALAGEDPADPVTAGAQPPSFGDLDGLDPDDLTVGVAPDFLEPARDDVAEAVRGAVDDLVAAGAERVEVSVPSLEHALPAYYVLVYSEFASAMQKFDGLRYGVRGDGEGIDEAMEAARSELGDEVKRRILLGTWTTTRDHRDRWHATARRAREAIRRDFASALEEPDVLLAPTMPVPAFERGSRLDDPLEMYAADLLTVSANLAGIPAGSAPVGGADPPVGLQVLGSRGADADVLRVMRLHERLQEGGA